MEGTSVRQTRLAVAVLLTLIVGSVAPGTALGQAAPDAAELTRLLDEFLAGASRNDAAVHDRFWGEPLVYTGSAGGASARRTS
jgi:hypothetical protein